VQEFFRLHSAGYVGKKGPYPFAALFRELPAEQNRASPALAGRTGQTSCEDSQSGIVTISKPVHSVLKWEERINKWSTIWFQKAGSVYDLIAKILPGSGLVYDLTAIDIRNGYHWFDVEDVDIAAPIGREILVEVQASGLCHTDLLFATHDFAPTPSVLGHELNLDDLVSRRISPREGE
jgi:Alcohol dehydrogenase GroES-like domain